MASRRPTIVDRAPRTRRAALALWLLLPACIDERVSLGHHETPLAPDAAGMGGAGGLPIAGGQPAPVVDAAAIDATVDVPIVEPPDAGPPPPASPCEGSVYVATLRCMVDDFGMLPAQPEQSMITQSVLTLEPLPFGAPSSRAAIRGELDFDVDAWDLSFHARLAGEIDCSRGLLHVEIVDGRARPISMPGPEIAFIGQLDGMTFDKNDTLEGMWWHAASSGGPPCAGPWSAVRRN